MVINTVHKPYPILFSIIGKRMGMTDSQRWKVFTFIEKYEN